MRVSGPKQNQGDCEYLIALARAAGGALIFGLPLLMTMEMWSLGGYMSDARLALLLALLVPALVALSHYIGFEPTFDVKEDLLDALAAFGVAILASGAVLFLFGVVGPGMSLAEIHGKITLQAVPASLGALLAHTQLGPSRGVDPDEMADPKGYGGQLFIMSVGALFLAFNLAPTEEMVLIAYQMGTWHTFALVLVSVGVMHAFGYSLEFRGQHQVPEGTSMLKVFLRFTVPGYGLALLISLYILWTFGRTDGLSELQIAKTAIVLGFPAAVGAAAARLIL